MYRLTGDSKFHEWMVCVSCNHLTNSPTGVHLPAKQIRFKWWLTENGWLETSRKLCFWVWVSSWGSCMSRTAMTNSCLVATVTQTQLITLVSSCPFILQHLIGHTLFVFAWLFSVYLVKLEETTRTQQERDGNRKQISCGSDLHSVMVKPVQQHRCFPPPDPCVPETLGREIQ